jgi:hypothetical protein
LLQLIPKFAGHTLRGNRDRAIDFVPDLDEVHALGMPPLAARFDAALIAPAHLSITA